MVLPGNGVQFREELTGFTPAGPFPLPARLLQTGLQLLVVARLKPVTNSLSNDILGMLPTLDRGHLECGVEPFVVEDNGHPLGHATS